jgi:hypothetical protein
VKTRLGLIIVMGALASVVVACDIDSPQATGTAPVVQMMPNLPGYRVVEGQSVQQYIAGLAQGASLLSGNPEMLLLIELADQVISCYREAGAVNMRIYSDESFPLSSGAIAIADRNRLTDPQTIFRCVGGQMITSSDQPTLRPCAHSYTLERDDNAFYFIYVGTTQEICQTFCANLEGCARY